MFTSVTELHKNSFLYQSRNTIKFQCINFPAVHYVSLNTNKFGCMEYMAWSLFSKLCCWEVCQQAFFKSLAESSWQGQSEVAIVNPMLGRLLQRIIEVSGGCCRVITAVTNIIAYFCMLSLLNPATWKGISCDVCMQDHVETYYCSDTERLMLAIAFSTNSMAVEALLVFNAIDVPCLIKVTASVRV